MQFVIVFGFPAVKPACSSSNNNDASPDFNNLLSVACLPVLRSPSTKAGKVSRSEWPGVYRIGYFQDVAEDKQFKFASEIAHDLRNNFQTIDSAPFVMIVRCGDHDIIGKRHMDMSVFDPLGCFQTNSIVVASTAYVQQVQFNKSAEVIFACNFGREGDSRIFYLNRNITNDELNSIVARFNPVNFNNTVGKIEDYKIFVIEEHSLKIIAKQKLSKETLSRSGMLQQINLVKELTRVLKQTNEVESKSKVTKLAPPVIQPATPVKSQEQLNQKVFVRKPRLEAPRPCKSPVKKPLPTDSSPIRPLSTYQKNQPLTKPFPSEKPPERPVSTYPKFQP